MTVALSDHTSVHHHRLAWAAVVAAVVAAVMVVAGLSVLAMVGFSADDEDFEGWQGAVVGVGLFGGVLVSVVAFLLAVVEKVRREHWALLWFPLLFAPLFILSLPLWFD